MVRIASVRYTDANRGKIHNRERGRQIIDFSGIRYGNITPTDLDGFFEKENRIFVFYEYKLPNAEMPRGQEIALTRVVDGLSAAGKSAVLFLCRHEVYDPEIDIKADKAIVEKLYWNSRWYTGKGLTVKEQTDRFINWAESFKDDVKEDSRA